jgi:hypothetical protein
MKKLILLLASILIAGQAGAKTLDWNGTLDVELWGGGATSLTFVGSGVATVNDSSGSAHLSTLRLAGGISGSGVIPITDPETTGTVKTVRQDTVRLGTGTLSGISGAPPLGANQIPIQGHSRVCIFQANCGLNLPLDLTKNDGNTGVGVAGTVTLGGNGTIRISIEGAPWTLATVSRIHQTVGGNFVTLSRAGFVHGAASASNSSTAANSGVIQLITPQQIKTAGLPGNSTRQALFSTLTLHFIPEPGLLLLLASGVLGLGLLGRSRMKKK